MAFVAAAAYAGVETGPLIFGRLALNAGLQVGFKAVTQFAKIGVRAVVGEREARSYSETSIGTLLALI